MIIRSISILGIRRGVILIPLVTLALISCLDFKFESEYEDINGITVEHVHSYYDLQGVKLRFNGDLGFIIHAESLLIYDFSEVAEAVYQGHYIAGSFIYDFQIYEDCAVLVTETALEIVSVNDSLPVQLSAVPLFLFDPNIRIQDDNAYVISGTQLYVADISDKQNPTLMTSIAFDHNIKQIEVDSHFAYVLTGNDFCVLNIQNPSSIILLASTSLHTLDIFNPERFFKKETFVYIAGFTTSDWLYTCELDVNNNIRLSNSILVPDRIRMFDASDEYTLAVSWWDTYLLNLQYPSSPCISEEIGFGGIHGTIQQNYVFVLTPYLRIFEIRQVE